PRPAVRERVIIRVAAGEAKMTWTPDPVAPPPGGTARVETIPEGTRITLRPRGAGRWFVVGFLTLWLAGWAFGELFALRELAGIIATAMGHRVSHPGHAPPAGFALGTAAFFLFWLAFWTFGGVCAARYAFALAWGADVLVLRGDGWTLKRGAATDRKDPTGPFPRARHFQPGEVLRFYLRGDGSLMADAGVETLLVTAAGAPEDRSWLRD